MYLVRSVADLGGNIIVFRILVGLGHKNRYTTNNEIMFTLTQNSISISVVYKSFQDRDNSTGSFLQRKMVSPPGSIGSSRHGITAVGVSGVRRVSILAIVDATFGSFQFSCSNFTNASPDAVNGHNPL
jgi:hypothetical protein